MMVSKQFDYLKALKNALQCRRTSQFIVNLGVAVQSSILSSINGSDGMHKCELLRLRCVVG